MPNDVMPDEIKWHALKCTRCGLPLYHLPESSDCRVCHCPPEPVAFHGPAGPDLSKRVAELDLENAKLREDARLMKQTLEEWCEFAKDVNCRCAAGQEMLDELRARSVGLTHPIPCPE